MKKIMFILAALCIGCSAGYSQQDTNLNTPGNTQRKQKTLQGSDTGMNRRSITPTQPGRSNNPGVNQPGNNQPGYNNNPPVNQPGNNNTNPNTPGNNRNNNGTNMPAPGTNNNPTPGNPSGTPAPGNTPNPPGTPPVR